MSDFDYWVKQKVAAGYLYRLAADINPLAMIIKLSNLMLHNGGKTLTNSPSTESTDPIYRHANIVDQKMQHAYIVGKNLQEQDLDWLQNLLEETVDSSIERTIISGQVEGKLACGKLICACKQVGEKTIKNAIMEQQLDSVEAISEHTDAGTGCGSCLGEVEAILIDCKTLA